MAWGRKAKRAQYRRRRKKKNFLSRWIGSLATTLRSWLVKLVLGLSVLTATFPSVIDYARMHMGSALHAINMEQLLMLPVIKEVMTPSGAAGTGTARTTRKGGSQPASQKKIQKVKNPLA